ncbi:hypothetical protein ZWY2020_034621 [Hordeum vulgare]|nr:hypothetical protein ZWY2020_034621 [Hordeum vulgare]
MAHRLLHGTLHATILEADNLTNPTAPPARPRSSAGSVLHSPSFLLPAEFRGGVRGDDRARQGVDSAVRHRRPRQGARRPDAGHRRRPVNPRWYEDFHIYCAHFAADVVFTVKAAQPIRATLIGRAYLPVRDLLDAGGQEIERRLDVLDPSKKKIHHGPTIHVRLRFCDVAANRREWGAGLGGARHPGVPYTFFSQRPGCRVTLYQDAHTPDAFAPRIPLSGGRTYQQGRCWEDVFDAISDARHLIYVTGWSVYTEITLIRDGSRPRPAAMPPSASSSSARPARACACSCWSGTTAPPLSPSA